MITPTGSDDEFILSRRPDDFKHDVGPYRVTGYRVHLADSARCQGSRLVEELVECFIVELDDRVMVVDTIDAEFVLVTCKVARCH